MSTRLSDLPLESSPAPDDLFLLSCGETGDWVSKRVTVQTLSDMFATQGPVGPQGPQGDPGATGPQGPQGDPGTNPSSADIVNLIYLVGSIYISIVATDPATLFGVGTWQAFGSGRTLISLDSGNPAIDAPEETGGVATVTPAGTVSQPTFTGDALGTHFHGPGTLLPNAHAGSAVAAHPSHTHDYTQVPNHVHPLTAFPTATGGSSGFTVDTSMSGTPANNSLNTANPTGGVATGTTQGPSASLTHSVTQPDAHTMSGSSEAKSAGTPAGTVSQPVFTGAQETNLPPFIVVYMFKRTA
jgi:hypothetical protein